MFYSSINREGHLCFFYEFIQHIIKCWCPFFKGKYGGEEKPVPSSVTTTGNILKLSFANTGDYKGDLTITIDTKTDFDPNESKL